uniref:Sod_Cu domain-containing protein n=1 Tax=Schistosoma curassoni TaxID=6186 RepID=A0A183JIJ4_9TREM
LDQTQSKQLTCKRAKFRSVFSPGSLALTVADSPSSNLGNRLLCGIIDCGVTAGNLLTTDIGFREINRAFTGTLSFTIFPLCIICPCCL